MKLIKFSELLKAQLVTFLRNSQGLLTIEFVIKVKIGGWGSRVVFFVFEYVELWNSGSQELSTESKYLDLVLRTDSSKLGPTSRVFSHFPFLYRKIGLKKGTFLTNFLSTFCVFMLETQFFG